MNMIDLSEEIVNLPSYVTVYGWVPFVVAISISVIFSTLYVRSFWSRNERDKCSSIISILGITIALLSAILIPVDVFLVSYMKTSQGTFKDWATNSSRQALEDSVTYTYYSLYGISLFFTFLILPLVYFSYEEKDEDRPNRVLPTAVMYTGVFLLVIAGLLIAGAFIPFKGAPPKNATDWEKINFVIKELYDSRGKDAITFVINVLTVYGMMNLILYTSVGMASFPIGLIKGYRPLAEEESVLFGNKTVVQSKISALRSKQARTSLSSREASQLADLEEEESLISKRSSLLEKEKSSFFHKCEGFSRIFNGVIGCISLVFSLLLIISLLLVNSDKLMNSLGMHMGYILTKNMLPNPLDYIMVKVQEIFPMDYIFFFCIIIFLVVCTISGMRYLGICCLCVPMYKIRPGRTPPQGLIMLSFILMFAVLGIHVLMYAVIPGYTTYGSQYYCDNNSTQTTNTTCNLQPCSLSAPQDECVMTRGAAFVLGFAYKAWIFSAVYYWMTWVFIIAFIFSFFFICIRSRTSSLEEAIDKDDFDDDEPMIRI